MKLPFHHEAKEKLFQNARSLKQRQTTAEEHLWKLLRNRKLSGRKFRRQHPVSSYIVDFYCHECRLVVEVDGYVHQTLDNPSYDEERAKRLQNLGLRVLRFSNEEVLNDTRHVLSKIRNFL